MPTECLANEELIRNKWFLIVLSSQALAGFLSFVVSLLVLRHSASLYFHINCKMLIIATLVLFVTHSLFITALQSLQIIRYLVISNPCDVELQSAICFTMRFPATTCMIAFAALQVAMVIERAIAIWNSAHYHSWSSRIGFTFISASVILSIAATAWATKCEDFSQKYAYCSAATPSTTHRIQILCIALSAVNVSTIAGIAALFAFNSIATKRKTFDLRLSYQLHENSAVIKLILPLTLFQTITYGIFSASSAIVTMFRESLSYVAYRTMFASAYLIPYYTLVSPILLWFIIRRSRAMRRAKLKVFESKISICLEKDLYFKAYTAMWRIPRPRN